MGEVHTEEGPKADRRHDTGGGEVSDADTP